MPADEQEFIGAVGFFDDDDGRIAVVVICEVELGEIGCRAVMLVFAVGAGCSGGEDADAASTEKFKGQAVGIFGSGLVSDKSAIVRLIRGCIIERGLF